MSRYFCHEQPDTLRLETRVVNARPGAVILERSPFHPGGGGQLADQGSLRWGGGEVRGDRASKPPPRGSGISSPSRWSSRGWWRRPWMRTSAR